MTVLFIIASVIAWALFWEAALYRKKYLDLLESRRKPSYTFIRRCGPRTVAVVWSDPQDAEKATGEMVKTVRQLDEEAIKV